MIVPPPHSYDTLPVLLPLQWLPPGWPEGEGSDDESNRRRLLLNTVNATNTTANATLTSGSGSGGKDRGGLLVGNLFYCIMAMLATVLFHLLIRLGFRLRHDTIPMVMHFPQVREAPMRADTRRTART